jgi:hypothetical protein
MYQPTRSAKAGAGDECDAPARFGAFADARRILAGGNGGPKCGRETSNQCSGSVAPPTATRANAITASWLVRRARSATRRAIPDQAVDHRRACASLGRVARHGHSQAGGRTPAGSPPSRCEYSPVSGASWPATKADASATTVRVPGRIVRRGRYGVGCWRGLR